MISAHTPSLHPQPYTELVHACVDPALVVDAADGAVLELNEAADALIGATFPEHGLWTLAGIDGQLHEALLIARRREVQCTPEAIGSALEWRATPLRFGDHGVLLVTVHAASAAHADPTIEGRSAALLEHAQDVLVTMDARGRVTHVTPSVRRVLGVSPEVFVNQGGPLLHPDDAEATRQAITRLIERPGDAAQIDYRARHDDGSWRLLSCVAHNLLHDPEVGALLVQLRDVSDRARAIRELRRREHQLATSQRIAHVGSWEWDVRTEIFEVSQEMARLFGRPLDERIAPRASLLELIHPDDRDRVQRRLEELREGGAPYELSYRIERPDGAQRVILSRAEITAHHHDGSARRISGTVRDITDLKRAEDELRAYALRLEDSNRDLREFAYVASHDLKEPLRKIMTFGERLGSVCGESLGQQGQTYLERMQGATSRMNTLIDDLLQYAQVATRARPFARVDLQELVGDVLDDLEIRAQETGAVIEIEPLPEIDGDAVQLRQVFQNLICNALKFHRPGQTPHVSIWAQLHTEHALGPGQWLEVFVEDDGIGFEQKHAESIFAPFQRLHSRKTYEGSGIGLAICRKIIERHGGRINVCATPGDGATFFMLLPVHQPAPRPLCAHTGCPAPSGE